LEEIDKAADIAINGKKKRRARLVHGDRVQLGAAEVAFSMFSESASRGQAEREGDDPDEDSRLRSRSCFRSCRT
jgi:hypothetical protein